MIDTGKFTFVATQAALKAGELLRKGFGNNCKVHSKEGKQNLVTEYDKAAEDCIIAFLLSHFPKHRFLAEESGESGHKKGEVIWIIDPLDGTVNFAHHIPIFSISIAAAVANEIVTGVIYQPMLGELFIAQKDDGAYLNGTRLQVSSCNTHEEAIVATGFPYNIDENPLHCLETFVKISKFGIPIRRLGSAAIDLAYLAAGRFDAYWEVDLNPWDMAAGKLLVEEAGGRISRYNGTPHNIVTRGNILATNGKLHEWMVGKLA